MSSARLMFPMCLTHDNQSTVNCTRQTGYAVCLVFGHRVSCVSLDSLVYSLNIFLHRLLKYCFCRRVFSRLQEGFFDKGGLGRCKSCPINGEPKASLSTAPRRLKSAVLVSYALLW